MGGPPVLLLHGGTGNANEYWHYQIEGLAKYYQLVVIEHKGYSENEATPVRFTISDLSSDVIEVMNKLGLQRANLCGLSLGGVIALQVALNWPEKVNRLVLADTQSEINTKKLELFVTQVLQRTMLESSLEHAYLLNLMWAHSEKYLTENWETLWAKRGSWLGGQPQGLLAVTECILDWNVTERLSEVKAPTMVLWGTEDVETPRHYSETLARLIPKAILVEIKGAGHKSCVEAPDLFNKALLAFFGGAA